jgi:hypothetical protein
MLSSVSCADGHAIVKPEEEHTVGEYQNIFQEDIDDVPQLNKLLALLAIILLESSDDDVCDIVEDYVY